MLNFTKMFDVSSTDKVSKNVSFQGYEFDIEENKWRLSKESSLNTEFINSFSSSIQEDIRCTLCYFAEHRSPSHTANIRNLLKLYLQRTNENKFTEHGLLTFKSSFDKSDEHRISFLRLFLKTLHVLDFKAVNENCLELINNWKLSSNQLGVPVLSLDPESGPFSDIEFEAILGGMDNSYAEGLLSNEEYSIVYLFAATGRRTIQLASLKVGDLRVDTKLLDSPIYVLNIPKAKVHGRSFRSLFTDFALIECIGQVLEQHIKDVIKNVNKIFERQLTCTEIAHLPLFPDYKDLTLLKKVSHEDVINWLNTDSFHLKSSDLSKKLKAVVDSLNIRSERTKELLKINAYRFRYTLGTRAARENAGVLTIATLLDHSDTQYAGVYVQNHPDHATTISRIMNGPLLKYANAFQGKVVKDEEEAYVNLAGALRIRTEDSQHNIGSCGTNTFCQDYAPIACYLCKKFMPWEDAPHHLILRSLVEERERIIKETGDSAIGAINDRAIIAVTQVMNQCEDFSKRKDSTNV